ncbi:unnamed protein product, partial [Mesorhabditis belari]|uniref:Uncharacterized protein n=1 Tax=Mesorhabditis belari TaxID=2138241 RepID=A0AAF3F810_9BILA
MKFLYLISLLFALIVADFPDLCEVLSVDRNGMVELEFPVNFGSSGAARRKTAFSEFNKVDQDKLIKICGGSDGKPCDQHKCIIVQTKEISKEQWKPVLIGDAFPKPLGSRVCRRKENL